MGGLFQSVELWIGLAFLLLVGLLLQSSRAQKKKHTARLARATHGAPRARSAVTGEQRLRKRDPNENSSIGQALANFSSIEKLASRLEIAGIALTPQQFLARALLATFIIAALLLVLGKPPLLAVLVGLVVGLGGAHKWVGMKIKRRQKVFLKLFPEGIELIVRGLRAGLPVAESFITVSKEIPPPVGNVFATITQQTGLGMPMEKALADTAARLGMTEFNFFVTTIILQRETGGNLGEILSNLAQVLRDRQMMKLKITAISSEARASAYIVGSLPFFVWTVLTITAPDYLSPLYNDFRGNIALGIAAGMLLFGGFIMRRMTQLEI